MLITAIITLYKI